jgi:putative DNA primase/helicase
MEALKLNPEFEDLNNSATILNHVEQLIKKSGTTPHTEILQQLIEQFEPLDFEVLAFPQAEKLRNKLEQMGNTITQPDGSLNADQELNGEREQYKDLNRQLDKLKLNLKHYLVLTIEISSKGTELRPFDRSDFITYQLPFEYNPQAKAPLFEAYLNKVLPDTERQRVLAEYLGFVFIKHGSNALKEEKALILYGTGANGKSVFFEVVNNLLGNENVSSYSLQSLTNDNGYFRAKLANKLVNYASEINGNLEASIFKQLVSGEPVEARLPYGQPFILKQYAKLIFNCNELPKDVEHTNAYFRRFLIIPFDVTIPPHEQDKSLHTKIIESELSGVFNWVLEGLNRLLEQRRFSDCEAAQKAVEQYRTESDSVQMFLNDYSYKVSSTNEMPLKEIFNEYKSYCIESGFRACSLRTLADRLRNSGYQTERKGYGTAVNAEK